MKRVCLRKALVVADFDRDGVEGVALGWWRIFWNTDWGNVRNLYNLLGRIDKMFTYKNVDIYFIHKNTAVSC